MSNRGIIIQARALSSRCPGKIFRYLPDGSGITVLEQVIRRVKRVKGAKVIIVATSCRQEDDEVIRLVQNENVLSFRGSEEHVLSRFYLAASSCELTDIIRITADCPCIDPMIIDELIQNHVRRGMDYTSNTLKRTFPRGLDAEVISFSALEKAYKNASEDFEQEHVTPYIYRSHPEQFHVMNLEAEGRINNPSIRVTLDTEEDYALLCAVYDYLYDEATLFRTADIIDLFEKKPWLSLINKRINQKSLTSSIEEEYKEALDLMERNGLKKARKFIIEQVGKYA
ncbi:MAG: glycosyltransferase family protein [Candidatus Eremiobacteraeota bacterium]|nr:glycosyltransferase family protein [Candidatus Eremiobacteraeota bacterium]